MSDLMDVPPSLLFTGIVLILLGLVSLSAIIGLVYVCFAFLMQLRASDLQRASVITSLLLISDVASLALYDLGGELRTRYGLWVNLAWTVLSVMWLVRLGVFICRLRDHWPDGRVRAFSPLALYAVGAILFWGLWMWPVALTLHGDAAMIWNFQRHEAQFNRLAMMREQDGQQVTICHRAEARREGVDAQRLAEYDALLDQTGVHQGVTLKRDHVQFRYWVIDHGMEQKGYAFATESPHPVVASVDRQRYQQEGVIYQKISDRWYLYSYFHNSMSDFCY